MPFLRFTGLAGSSSLQAANHEVDQRCARLVGAGLGLVLAGERLQARCSSAVNLPDSPFPIQNLPYGRFRLGKSDPQPLPYLDSAANRRAGAIDISLEVWLQTSKMRDASFKGDRIVRTGFAEAAYWTVAQMVTHHTNNGCNLMPGDLLGTGTLSATTAQSAACLPELTQGGRVSLDLSNGEHRTFLEDGDTITLRAFCQRPGVRSIGFGECAATALKARA